MFAAARPGAAVRARGCGVRGRGRQEAPAELSEAAAIGDIIVFIIMIITIISVFF